MRAAVANILELPDVAVEVVTPDVGGGFGTKVVHPYPEEVLVPWAARLLGREVKWVEDRYEHFVSATHERGQQHHVRVGFDDDGTILGMEVEFWHDTGAYSPYGIVLPIITATQLPGPYRHRHYRVTFTSLYTNTVTVTPYRARRPQGCFVMERTIDRIAEHLGLDRTDVGPQPHPARRVPLRLRHDVPGRAAAHLRLGRVPGLARAAQADDRLGRVRRRAGRSPRRGTAARHRPGLLRRGHGSAPTRAGTSTSRRTAA